MSEHVYQPARLFTVDEANARLPLVQAITSDLVELFKSITDRKQRLDHLTEGRDMSSGNPYDDELAHIAEELEKDTAKAQEYVKELTDLGVELKSPLDGLVDFPSEMDGRIVYLCWKLGEDEVQYWHELEDGFGGRQSLTAAVGADDAINGSLDTSP